MENAIKELEIIAIKHSKNSNKPIEAIFERELSTIKNVERMTILDLLEENGEMGFDDIIQKIDYNDSVLAYHISQLTKYKWLDMRESEGKSYFRITEKAKDYLNIIHKYIK